MYNHVITGKSIYQHLKSIQDKKLMINKIIEVIHLPIIKSWGYDIIFLKNYILKAFKVGKQNFSAKAFHWRKVKINFFIIMSSFVFFL